MQLPQLDLQLAWAFRDVPVVWDRLALLGVQLSEVEQAWRRHLHLRNAGQTLLTLEEHAEIYGVQPRQESSGGVVRLHWPLTLWPEYELAGFFARDTGVVEEGMRFRVPPVVDRVSEPLTFEEAAALLRVGEHTEVELAAALGPGDADVHNGWSPEALFYYDLVDGRVLQCRTIHGLLVEVSARDARRVSVDTVDAAPARRRWWEFWKPAA